MIYRTKIENIYLHDAGWLELPSGVRISKLPLLDRAGWQARGMARGSDTATAWAKERGYRLPEASEYIELHRHPSTLHIAPMTIYVDKGNASQMSSREWCERHDREVWSRLAEAGFVAQPVANFGKHLDRQGDIVGWDTDPGPGVTLIQNESSAHRPPAGTPIEKWPGQADYGTGVHVVDPWGGSDRDTKPEKVTAATAASSREEIRTWQKRLNTSGFGPLVEDGLWGPRTAAATQRWKDAHPVAAAGVLDLEAIPFVQAKHTGGRRKGSILGVCIHVSQNAEHPSGAEYLQATAGRGDGVVSWHYSVDNNSVCQSVLDSDVAFAAGPGNDRWLHVELVGRVEQGVAGWADAFSTAQLAIAARLVAALLAKHSCSFQRIGAEQLLHGDTTGICGHSDFSAACVLAQRRNLRIAPWWDASRIGRGYPSNWRPTNHGDPGAAFPWDAFVEAVRAAG
jgi:N-acetyl-anhydromuramyl-L-alanine amidase AmpD